MIGALRRGVRGAINFLERWTKALSLTTGRVAERLFKKKPEAFNLDVL